MRTNDHVAGGVRPFYVTVLEQGASVAAGAPTEGPGDGVKARTERKALALSWHFAA